MTLAELVIGIENGKLVRREPSEEEIHGRFKYFRERNHLVEEMLMTRQYNKVRLLWEWLNILAIRSLH